MAECKLISPVRSPSTHTHFVVGVFISPMDFTGPLGGETKLIADDSLFIYSDYVDGPTAKAQNLTCATSDAFVLRADFKNKVASGERGRKSVRLISKETFNHHVSVYATSNPSPKESTADPLSHHPQLRCSTHARGLLYMARNLGVWSG